MKTTNATDIEELLKETCKYIGLDSFQVTSYLVPQDNSLVITLSRNLSSAELRASNTDAGAFVREVIHPIFDKIASSAAVRDSKAELTNKIQGLTVQLELATKRIEELTPYFNYYTLAKELSSGKS